jgi:hypothetical protein
VSSSALAVLLQQQWQCVGKIQDLTAFCRPGMAACLVGEEKFQQVYIGTRQEADILALFDEFAVLGVTLEPFVY